ncbi:terpenoid synthase [Phlegmacium glaucopus]|nr:terpenoid synthase [Phlegmacium glaucopus]
MSEIDLPRESSGTEWWYYNFHLSLVDGRKASAFITFFQVTSLKPTTLSKTPTNNNDSQCKAEDELCYSHFVNFAISILSPDSSENSPSGSSSVIADDASKGQYYFTSAMDPDNAAYMLSKLEAKTEIDLLIRCSLLEIMRNKKIPAPDIFIPGDVSVSREGHLSLKYGDLASVVCHTNPDGEDVYHIVAHAEDGSYGFELDLTPRKPPVNHRLNGVVQGNLVDADDGIYYCFVSRCEVSGSLRIDNSEVRVDRDSSLGWYDREFGGGIQKWSETSTRTTDSSWKWASAQLSNGWDLMIYTLSDVDSYNGEGVTVREKKAIAISPEGTSIECDEHSFEHLESWMSMTTLNSYGTKWKLIIPQLELDVFLEAPFVRQECRTICAVRGYWEGRVTITGTMGGAPVNGLGFVENVPAQLMMKFEEYLKRIGYLTVKEVSKIYPDHFIDAEHAMKILAFQSPHNTTTKPTEPGYLPPDRFTQDMRLDVLYENMFAPVRYLIDRGGKSWRAFLGITCIMSLGLDPEPFKPILAIAELLHTATLIIDDIQDNSPMRRGISSVHTLWGNATAINAGTAAYFMVENAVRSLTRNLRPEQTVPLDIASQQQSDLDDILSGRVHPSTLEKRVIATHRLKTATVAANIAKISAYIAGASPSQIHALVTYVERVGIAFQIIDDVYDIRGWSHVNMIGDGNQSYEKPPKRRGDDIRSGKINAPIAKAGSMMPLDEARWVWETVISKTGDDDVTTQKVIDKLEVYGIVDACVKEAHKMVDDSWANLEGHLKDSIFKVSLRALGWYLVKYNF